MNLKYSTIKKIVQKVSLLSLISLNAYSAMGPKPEYFDPNNPINRFDFNLKNAVDVYFNPSYVYKFSSNLDKIVGKFGTDPNNYSIQEYITTTGTKKLDEIVSNSSLLKILKSIRTNFQKFFKGIPIRGQHDFEAKIEQIDLAADWENVGAHVVGYVDDPNKVLIMLHIEAKSLDINIGSVKIKDKEHDFIGEIGGENIFIKLDKDNTENLRLLLPLEVKLIENYTAPEITVHPIESNISQVKLVGGYNKLNLPSIKVKINGNTTYLKAGIIERKIKKDMDKIISSLQENLHDFFTNKSADLIQSSLLEMTQFGFKDYLELPFIMGPSLKTKTATGPINFFPKYTGLFGLKLNETGMVNHHLNLNFKLFVEAGGDYLNSPLEPYKYFKRKINPKFLTGKKYDAIAGVNMAVINKYLKISCDNYTLDTINIDGRLLFIDECPYIRPDELNNEIVLETVISISNDHFSFESFGDGVASTAMYNLLKDTIKARIKIRLKLGRNAKGGYGLQFSRIIPEEVGLYNTSVEYESTLPTIKEYLRDFIIEINNKYSTNWIVADLNIPSDLDGTGKVVIDHLKTKIDNNGHILFFMNMKI